MIGTKEKMKITEFKCKKSLIKIILTPLNNLAVHKYFCDIILYKSIHNLQNEWSPAYVAMKQTENISTACFHTTQMDLAVIWVKNSLFALCLIK